MIEEWKQVVWYEGLYEVSNLWRIKSIKNNKWKYRELILKFWTNKWYYNVWLTINNKQKRYQVHRIVWLVFLWLSIENTKICVCHKNDIRNDNTVENLFLGTHKDNIQDMYRKWRRWINWMKWKLWKLNHKSRSILQYSKNLEFIKEFWSIREAERELWISRTNILYNCQWKTMESKHNFIFTYKYA
jgi:hypothetical protein